MTYMDVQECEEDYESLEAKHAAMLADLLRLEDAYNGVYVLHQKALRREDMKAAQLAKVRQECTDLRKAMVDACLAITGADMDCEDARDILNRALVVVP